jgi:hypothetical protein
MGTLMTSLMLILVTVPAGQRLQQGEFGQAFSFSGAANSFVTVGSNNMLLVKQPVDNRCLDQT